ncbi:hypothetical protein F7725_029080 [Dissostichus mawsoni]|uniref:Uncharacterized protein n=1 Tax=Dissostichus mawsoni TaxID=36200 RepID=A0A7J5XHF3_DISMA|nr:hypothetical protein F7725_029080 [Dissostichus mawsoni]
MTSEPQPGPGAAVPCSAGEPGSFNPKKRLLEAAGGQMTRLRSLQYLSPGVYSAARPKEERGGSGTLHLSAPRTCVLVRRIPKGR